MIIRIDGEVSEAKKETPKTENKQEEQKAEKPKKKRTIIPNVAEQSQSNSFSVSNSNTFFSPLIIKIAKEHHISFEELARIPATGHEDRLRKSDLFQYIEDGRPYKFAQPVAQQDPTAYRIPQLKFDKGNG